MGSAAFLPRDGNDRRYAASGVTESSEDSEDEVEDSMYSGDFCFAGGTTAFFFGTVVGSGSTDSVADTKNTDSSLGTRRPPSIESLRRGHCRRPSQSRRSCT